MVFKLLKNNANKLIQKIMKSLSNSTSAKNLNLNKKAASINDKIRFNKEFPLLYIDNETEYRLGFTCPVGYVESEEDRSVRLKFREKEDQYHNSPEWAEEYAKIKKEGELKAATGWKKWMSLARIPRAHTRKMENWKLNLLC
jgi:hypothetical protein